MEAGRFQEFFEHMGKASGLARDHGGHADGHKPSMGTEDSVTFLESPSSQRIQDQIHPFAMGDLTDAFFKVFLPVIDGMMNAEVRQETALLFRSRRSKNCGPHIAGDLNGDK